MACRLKTLEVFETFLSWEGEWNVFLSHDSFGKIRVTWYLKGVNGILIDDSCENYISFGSFLKMFFVLIVVSKSLRIMGCWLTCLSFYYIVYQSRVIINNSYSLPEIYWFYCPVPHPGLTFKCVLRLTFTKNYYYFY